MIQTVTFLILTVLSAAALAGILLLAAYCVIARIRKNINPKRIVCLKKTAIFFAVAIILNAGLATLSQFTASTPHIVDENGKTPENSIAELIKLELNGR